MVERVSKEGNIDNMIDIQFTQDPTQNKDSGYPRERERETERDKDNMIDVQFTQDPTQNKDSGYPREREREREIKTT